MADPNRPCPRFGGGEVADTTALAVIARAAAPQVLGRKVFSDP